VRATAGSLPSALVRRLLCVSCSDLDGESDHDRKWNASRAESMLACPAKCFWERISRITCVDYSNRKGMVMQTIRVRLGRLYNASACSNLGATKSSCPSTGIYRSAAYIGPNPQHIIGTWTVGPSQPQDPAAQKTVYVGREYVVPSPEKFPSAFYTELVAVQQIGVKGDLASAFQSRDMQARAEILRIAEEHRPSFTMALDCVAGILGLVCILFWLLHQSPNNSTRIATKAVLTLLR
jgi:hypothetical protein